MHVHILSLEYGANRYYHFRKHYHILAKKIVEIIQITFFFRLTVMNELIRTSYCTSFFGGRFKPKKLPEQLCLTLTVTCARREQHGQMAGHQGFHASGYGFSDKRHLSRRPRGFTLLRGVPVKDEPGGVHGSDEPAVRAEHVDQEHCGRKTCRQRDSSKKLVSKYCQVKMHTLYGIFGLP